MKLITAIVQDKDSNKLGSAFIKADVRATRLTSSGGFLRAGNTTFMIAIEDDRVADVLKVIEETSQKRKQFMVPPMNLDTTADVVSYPMEVEVGGATVFTQDIDAFYRF